MLAGGQSLLPLLSMRLAAPHHLVDVNRLHDLDYVRVDGDRVRVGALARHATVLASDEAAAGAAAAAAGAVARRARDDPQPRHDASAASCTPTRRAR